MNINALLVAAFLAASGSYAHASQQQTCSVIKKFIVSTAWNAAQVRMSDLEMSLNGQDPDKAAAAMQEREKAKDAGLRELRATQDGAFKAAAGKPDLSKSLKDMAVEADAFFSDGRSDLERATSRAKIEFRQRCPGEEI